MGDPNSTPTGTHPTGTHPTGTHPTGTHPTGAPVIGTSDAGTRIAGPLRGTPVTVGAVTLDVHVDGPADGEVVLLVCGLAMHRTSWPPMLLDALHAAGYRTVAVDNRDSGCSAWSPPRATDPPGPAGDAAPYGLRDLASDLLGVLDHLEVDRAHVVGVSMGGMIAQRLAIDAPTRVASLHLLMTTTGDWSVGLPREDVRWVLKRDAALDLEAYLASAQQVAEAIGSPGHLDPRRVEALARAEHARGLHLEATPRQLAAILADGDRTAALASIEVPTLVVHGTVDPLIDVSGGRALAAAIPGARYLEIAGLGHDLAPFAIAQCMPVMLDVMAAAHC